MHDLQGAYIFLRLRGKVFSLIAKTQGQMAQAIWIYMEFIKLIWDLFESPVGYLKGQCQISASTSITVFEKRSNNDTLGC